MTRLITFLLLTGCLSTAQHPSCPDKTKAETFFDYSSTKTFACTRASIKGKRSYGWELSYRGKNGPFISLKSTDPDNLYITCRTKVGGTALDTEDIEKMRASHTYNAICLDKPLRPIFDEFEKRLIRYYKKAATVSKDGTSGTP